MINHEHNFIFIHIPRTGGTSIEYTFTKKTECEAKHTYPLGWKKSYPQQWESYFKFTSVRNPWDRVVSQWAIDKHWYGNKFKKTFKEFVKYPQGFPLQPQLWFLTEPNRVKYQDIIKYVEDNINYIIRFENLHNDFSKVCELVGSPKHKLPKKYHSQEVRKSRPYQEYYDTETKDIVSRIYDIDIQYFNYKFNE